MSKAIYLSIGKKKYFGSENDNVTESAFEAMISELKGYHVPKELETILEKKAHTPVEKEQLWSFYNKHIC